MSEQMQIINLRERVYNLEKTVDRFGHRVELLAKAMRERIIEVEKR